MTYEEYVEAVRNACKDDLVVKTYPEEFKKYSVRSKKKGSCVKTMKMVDLHIVM